MIETVTTSPFTGGAVRDKRKALQISDRRSTKSNDGEGSFVCWGVRLQYRWETPPLTLRVPTDNDFWRGCRPWQVNVLHLGVFITPQTHIPIRNSLENSRTDNSHWGPELTSCRCKRAKAQSQNCNQNFPHLQYSHSIISPTIINEKLVRNAIPNYKKEGKKSTCKPAGWWLCSSVLGEVTSILSWPQLDSLSE